MKCPKCGNQAPEGSAFCNQCGTPLNLEISCPACGESIPANSVFCPKCGKMVRNDMAEEPVQDISAAAPVATEAAPVSAAPAASHSQQHREWKEPVPVPPVDHDDEDDDEDDDDEPRSNFNRNLLIGVLAAVLLIGGLMLMRQCGDGGNPVEPVPTDSTSVQAATPATGEAITIFTDELNRNNLMGDGASAGAAVRFPGNGADVPDRIAGVTYLSNSTSRSFFKVYTLTRSGSIWNVEPAPPKYLNGRTISMDNNSLIADINQVPRAVKVNGNDCIYFAYLNPPVGSSGGEGSNSRVSLCLYDINNKKFTTLDYDGPVKTKDGRQYIYGKPLQTVNSPELRFLQQEAASIKKIYFPTEEELKAEQEAKEKAEEEKALSGPENAGAKWTHDNGESLTSLKGGEEVRMKAASYDKPIFNLKDMSKKIESDAYIVFADNKGAVYGFNKNSRKYFVIYTPSGGQGSPADIGFGDDNRILRMRTADGHISYDLVSDKAKMID